jgi:hypothetical protein
LGGRNKRIEVQGQPEPERSYLKNKLKAKELGHDSSGRVLA